MTESKNYIILYDFMMGGGMKLKNLNLLIYALIYSFWTNGRVMFQSCSNIADLFGCTREAVNRSLKELEDAKYIVRLPQTGRYGNHYYTIDEKTLNEKLTVRCDKNAQVEEGCDETAQVGVTKPHRMVCENRTGRCDDSAHNNIKVQEGITMKGDSNTVSPLPSNCRDDEECRRLWSIILESPKWTNRCADALAEATKVLADQHIEVCRLMLAHTIEGDYPRIYEPTDEMKQKAKLTSPRCAEKSHHLSLKEVTDDVVFRELYPFFPKELMEKIFVGKSAGERGLRFTQNEGRVAIYCAPEVKTWLETIPETLSPILGTWVGQTYSGYDLIDTIN